jgi:hypothetical protein
VRATFLLLLLANLLFLAWWQGYLGPRSTEGHEPQRLDTQVSPDRLHIVKAKGERSAGVADTPSPAPTAVAPNPSAKAVAAPPLESCREIGALALDEAEHIKAALAKAAPEITVTQKPVPEPQSYWVHIPPLPTRQAAEKKSAEVKRLGFAEYYVVQDEGANRYAISLGLFGSEQAANDFVATLAKKGIRGARVQVRNKEASKAKLELRGTLERLGAAVVAELIKKSGASLGDCPAP